VSIGQKLIEFHIPKLWNELMEKASVNERRAAVEVFNKENQWKKTWHHYVTL